MTGTASDREVTEEMLMALADDELDAASSAALFGRIARDPDLARRYAPYERTRARLQEALAPGPVPDHLIAAIMAAPVAQGSAPRSGDGETRSGQAADPGAGILPLPPPGKAVSGRNGTQEARHEGAWPGLRMAAIAACLAAVMAGPAGWFLGARGVAPGGTEEKVPDVEVSAAALAGLATGATQEGTDGVLWRALGSYEAETGLCRVISRESPGQSVRSVLCEQNGSWSIALTLSAPISGAFIPASDTATALLDQYLDMIGAGAALLPEEEARRLREIAGG